MNSINSLLLIPAVFLAQDFLPTWFLYTTTLQLIILSFVKCKKYFGYINFYFIWLLFDTIGKQIIPETMIPALATLLLVQMFYNQSLNREESFLFFLWIGIFSVFSSSFSYLLYSIVILFFYFIQQSNDSSLSLKAVIKTFIDQKLQLTITALLAIILFIFFPRFNNFLPSANAQNKGDIGYSQKIDNTNTANLQMSSKIAFYAELEQKVPPESLYWRGRVHAGTDGYNWRSTTIKPIRNKINNEKKTIKVKMKYEQDFGGDVILLDHPLRVVTSNLGVYKVAGTDEYKFFFSGYMKTVLSI
jgi:hypothetical protein